MKHLKLFSLFSFAAIAIAFSLTSAFAETEPASGDAHKLNPWVDCGIGAMIFDNTKWAAATSNVIWDLGTTAVTSATASPNTCESKRSQMHAALFINSSYENLAEETAAGQGEHLTALLGIYGCNPAQQTVAIQAIRSAMGKSVAQPNYANQSRSDQASTYYSIVDSSAGNSCKS